MISEKGFILENGTEIALTLGFGTYLVQEEKSFWMRWTAATAISTPPEDTKTKK